jgi:hypothetical protein
MVIKNQTLDKTQADLEESKKLGVEAGLNIMLSLFYYMGILSMFMECNMLIYLSALGIFIISLKLSQAVVISLIFDAILIPLKFILYVIIAKIIWEISLIKLFNTSGIVMPFFDVQILYSWNISSIFSNNKFLSIVAASYIFWGFTVDYLLAKTGYLLELVDFKKSDKTKE